MDSSEIEWKGVSLEDIYGTKGPWHYNPNPLSPSKYHTVLYEMPATLADPPKPHYYSQAHHWHDDYVKMPFSPKNIISVKSDSGDVILKQRWNIIQEALLQPISNSRELEEAIGSYNYKLPKLLALHHFFDKVLEVHETEHFFTSVLPGIINLALRLPELIPGNIPLLKKGLCKSISLSQLQIACILANAFLCTFPWRQQMSTYPGINFVRLFAAHLKPTREQAIGEKLKCLCHYFRKVLSKEPVGVVTFERKCISRMQMPRWDKIENNLAKTKLCVTADGTIEDNGNGLLQVDFANKYVGGGVLGFGCVQEEIRYVICPELITSRLFTEILGSNEALVVAGVERYSNYKGYGDNFEWNGNCNDETPYDKYGRRQTTVVAIDATHFSSQMDQFSSSFIIRELNKAYTGFHSRSQDVLPAVATGNWGCGAFRGDATLKSIIQLMACNAANRDLVYFTFGDINLRDKICNMYTFLVQNQVTIVQLWRILCRFYMTKSRPEALYNFIKQTYSEHKNQMTIKQFFACSKNDTKEAPSTSKMQESIATNDCIIEMNNVEGNDPVVNTTDIQSSPDFIETSQDEREKVYKKKIKIDSGNKFQDRHNEIVNLMNLMHGNGENSTSN